MGIWDGIKFEEFKGKTFKAVTVSESNMAILFEDMSGEKYLMYHQQDCCESVAIESIDGDLQSLVGNEIVLAEEVDNIDRGKLDDWDESYTWTYYKLATTKGYVTIRWYGESNGYYSEEVDLIKVDDETSKFHMNEYFK